MPNIFETELPQNSANHAALTPVHFLSHAATTYPDNLAVVHGDLRYNYATLQQRCQQLASALSQYGIGPGNTVSIIAPNIPAHLEAHFGVPMTGAVLNSINIRLDADTFAYIFDDGECDVLLIDGQFADVAKQALAKSNRTPLVIDLDDTLGPQSVRIGSMTYEEFLLTGQPDFQPAELGDEWQSLALNYTSGTTGKPKGLSPSRRSPKCHRQ